MHAWGQLLKPVSSHVPVTHAELAWALFWAIWVFFGLLSEGRA